MLDFVLGVAFAGLAVRGWLRGFVREAMDLVGLVAGLALAFRLSGLVGPVVAGMAGTSEDVSRLIGGVIVFVAVGVGAAVLAARLHRWFDLPGLRLSNRLAGSALALAWGLFIATFLLSLLAALSPSPALAARVEESAVARTLTSPTSWPQRTFRAVAGDRVLSALLSLREELGRDRLVVEDDQVVEFPAAEPEQLSESAADARRVFDLLNMARIDEGLEPLAWSDALAEVGAAFAEEMYLTGRFGHVSPLSGSPADRVDAAGIRYVVLGENLALAPSAAGAHDGLMGSPGHRANILQTEFVRVGIGVVDGPLGLMVVQVFTG